MPKVIPPAPAYVALGSNPSLDWGGGEPVRLGEPQHHPSLRAFVTRFCSASFFARFSQVRL